ncbi:MAG: BolA family transcriptional regulator [Spiribacter salinus]|jgi:BolA protein|uniref:BolA family transcriptional regulator n=1 Tax=Spiribacter salinus TaxID=1335746 RepID=A0A540VU25_9GAMM|nr:BolA family protein [Spiribacter sp.]MDR9454128.1 BolA family protein [Spiribacter sp.]TQF00233.1 MAG: BolA family transcriptional regulator [Spiribacter salinus]
MTANLRSERPAMIRERLEQGLSIESLSVRDDSHLHAGHAGAQAGGGHFHVRIVSDDFANHSQVARHRLVYQAMGDAMRNDCIHALSIEALTPDEDASGDLTPE